MRFDRAASHLRKNTKEELLILAVALLAILLISYGAAGPRGTDQYWYVADVTTLSQGLEPLTNNIFPGPMLREGVAPEKNYFMHNSPVMSVVALLAKIVDPYKAWILINATCHLIVALCIFLVSVRITNRSVAALVTCCYLISPLALWQAINPLLEMSYAAVLGLQLLCFTYRDQKIARTLAYVFFLIGVVSHPIFIVPALLWGVWAFIENRKPGLAGSVLLWVSYTALVVFSIASKGGWFPSSFQPDIEAIVASVVPNKSNMFWHYSENLPTIDAQLMVDKTTAALKKHFFTVKFAPLYVFTNIALIFTLLLCLLRFKKWWKTLVPLGLFGCQYIAMILLQQNHPRFQQIVVTVVFTVIGIGLYEFIGHIRFRAKTVTIVALFFFVSLLVVSSLIMQSGRAQSITEGEELERLTGALSVLPANARIVGIDVKPHNPFSYAVRPREMLFIRTDMLDEDGINRAIGLFKPTYFIVKRGKRLIDGALIAEIRSSMFGELEIYHVDLD